VSEFEQGDIVLATFPFSSLKGAKTRPCLILARSAVPDDYVVAYISSSEFASQIPTSVKITHSIEIATSTGLKTTSYLRADKLYTLHRSVIVGKIGSLPNSLIVEAKASLKKLFGL
jgi:mRNA interferase MazF